MKLTINKLIANDIINYGMDQTSGFDYSVGLDEYLEQYDEDSQKYILENLSEICSDISANERVADFIFEEETKDFNMVFYWGYLLNDVEKIVFNKSQKLNDEMDFEDIRNIANDFVDSDTFNKDLESKINNYSSGVELA
jgi:hypothetical protein